MAEQQSAAPTEVTRLKCRRGKLKATSDQSVSKALQILAKHINDEHRDEHRLFGLASTAAGERAWDCGAGSEVATARRPRDRRAVLCEILADRSLLDGLPVDALLALRRELGHLGVDVDIVWAIPSPNSRGARVYFGTAPSGTFPE